MINYTNSYNEKPSALKKMRPLLRSAIKLCRQERFVPPSVEMKNAITVLRHAIKVCRQKSEQWRHFRFRLAGASAPHHNFFCGFTGKIAP